MKEEKKWVAKFGLSIGEESTCNCGCLYVVLQKPARSCAVVAAWQCVGPFPASRSMLQWLHYASTAGAGQSGRSMFPSPFFPSPTPLLRQPEHSTQRSHRLSEVQCVQLEASRCLSHLPARLSITRQRSRARQTHKALLKCSNCIYEAVLIYLTDCMMGLRDMVMMSKACE